jgi:hypothetical protein
LLVWCWELSFGPNMPHLFNWQHKHLGCKNNYNAIKITLFSVKVPRTFNICIRKNQGKCTRYS